MRNSLGHLDLGKSLAVQKRFVADIEKSVKQINPCNSLAICKGSSAYTEYLFVSVIRAEIYVSAYVFVNTRNFRVVLRSAHRITDTLGGLIVPDRGDYHILGYMIGRFAPRVKISAVLYNGRRNSVLSLSYMLLKRAADKSASVKIVLHDVGLLACVKDHNDK